MVPELMANSLRYRYTSLQGRLPDFRTQWPSRWYWFGWLLRSLFFNIGELSFHQDFFISGMGEVRIFWHFASICFHQDSVKGQLSTHPKGQFIQAWKELHYQILSVILPSTSIFCWFFFISLRYGTLPHERLLNWNLSKETAFKKSFCWKCNTSNLMCRKRTFQNDDIQVNNWIYWTCKWQEWKGSVFLSFDHNPCS